MNVKETYVTPEMELLRQKELIEIEEEKYKKEHTMVCPPVMELP